MPHAYCLPYSLSSLSTLGGLVLLTTLFGGCAQRPDAGHEPDYLVYVGTNVASATEPSIFLYRLTPATGALTRVSAEQGGISPTYLTISTDRRQLFAVSETATFQGANSGGVSAFAVAPRTGALTLLNQQPSGGGGPCYISLDRSGRAALVANYGGGNVSVLPLLASGQLAAPSLTDQHQDATGPHKNQDHAHAHCFLTDPANAYAFAVDLGTDRVYAYRHDAAQNRFTQLPEPAFQARPGAGPRHLTFHPNGRWAFLINELNSTITALAYDAAAGRFRELQTVSALPAGYSGPNSCADIHVSPNGRFLYASNRGHNSIAVFAIEAAAGTLTPVQDVDTQGQTPRNFTLTPSGRLLLVANQNSGSLVSFFIEPTTGRLTSTGQTATVPSPMVVQVVEDFTR